jgi:diguanylate cyclase (GGDEF)-like protein
VDGVSGRAASKAGATAPRRSGAGGSGPRASRRGTTDNAPAPSVDALEEIWQRHRGEALGHLDLVEQALAALSTRKLDEQLHRMALRAVHMLAGTVGTFGFARASEIAHELEDELRLAVPARLATMTWLLAVLRRELDAEAGASQTPHQPEPERGEVRLLIVDRDRNLCERLVVAGERRGMICESAATPGEAWKLASEHRPAAVLLDIAVPPDELPDAYTLLSELSSSVPPIPVVVLTGHDTFTDRVEAARRGSRAFLPKSLLPAEVLGAVEQVLTRDRLAATRVLIVDDDPTVLDLVTLLLSPHDVELFTLLDPQRFWDTLEDVEPELLILDFDMPGLSGPELCRTVRNDPRWAHLAVIFVTARTDAESVERVFNAGADDYVPKPIVGPELVTRVSNRLERLRLHRSQAETDGLTGLSNRVTSEKALQQLAELSERFGTPLSVALLDVDRFKSVNDTHGHAAGDAVLRSLGEYLRREFRGSDVVGRWGGEEFVVGMYGMHRADAVARLTSMLERFRDEKFQGSDGAFGVTYSAGVSEYGLDGKLVDALCEVADEALYRAKQAGRARVLTGAGADSQA